MDFQSAIPRRDVLAAAATALTTSLFTGNVKGANDQIAVGFIGLGAMGSGNLGYAMKVPAVQPVAVCDIYQPHLERAVAAAAKGGVTVKPVKDFRDILADKSIDAVCISTPDHWHAYMMVEACKAGKDVYVEKPACTYIEEGQKMVQAARKYKRVVQAGTMQRSGGYFKKAAELVAAGAAGDVTFCHTFQIGLTKKEGFGNPKDSDPPSDLDWDMWLGPAPKVPFNANRWGVKTDDLPDLPLLLGLRGRRHDGLGRAPDRPSAPVLSRSDAHRDCRARRQVLRRGQHRDAGHDAGDVPIPEIPDHLREPHLQSDAAVRPRAGRGHRHPRDRGDHPGQPQRLLADSQQHQNAGDRRGKRTAR